MNKKRYLPLIPVTIIAFLAMSCDKSPANWTHFRGSSHDGIAAPGEYPTQWNDSTNIRWIAPDEGKGWSSPVVLDKQVWLTSASADGKEMYAVCIDLESGEQLFKTELFTPDSIFRIHAVNSYATPTPAIEEGYVYVHFGRYGTACINTKTGEKVWQRTDLQCEHVQGPGSSLLLHDEKLIVHMEGTDVQDIYALNKRTGETIWKTSRNPVFYEHLAEIGKKAYTTPIVITVDGRELLISNGSAVANAFDIETGEEVWHIPFGEDSTVAMPVEYNGKIYFYTSFETQDDGERVCELWAVDPRGKGDLSGNILWKLTSPLLQLSTQVIADGLLYTVDSRSNLQCIDPETGKVIWVEKLKGKFNSSPIAANGNIYVSTTRGETIVFKQDRSYDLVAENNLEGEIWATPAFVDGSILMRTSKGLYRIGLQ
jgi:outer membrane protein assembly factor BamB